MSENKPEPSVPEPEPRGFEVDPNGKRPLKGPGLDKNGKPIKKAK